ncbi:aminotransferase class V-fold PLP-dependent enzyme [Effusibacillus dendaii]|uniref:cysteine desulfurase n=1 Tax=Effusibacillus dendaii TaxID=2743772 RepID=A0A7I8DBB8_9BACL|nr:aminotransferase class V-fold PLP-dependent enzyme [Effusibacillus dendaii]BCJ87483.1 cysteine desulfurase [Effusibacillus dendaii]
MIYLDNAASSWPKPPQVVKSMEEVLLNYAANPGRSGHQLAAKAAEKIFETRARIAKLFHVKNPNDIVFTQNATESTNLALKGFLKPGDHVLTTSLEHNSIRRPLEFLKAKGVEVTYLNIHTGKDLHADLLEQSFRENTKLVAVTHASNVTGTILPIEMIGEITSRHGIRLLVDASQTAGFCSIDVDSMKIDLLAFTGHKSLYGPQGTGGLYVHPELDLVPLLHGGTGGYSELIDQPPIRPERFESGTRNTVGIAGLGAGVNFIEQTGLQQIQQHEQQLANYLVDELAAIPSIAVYGWEKNEFQCPIVSFAVEGFDANEIGFILDAHYQIAVRAGLHCSPLAHDSLGTSEQGGLVRVSFGYFNSEEDVKELVHALKDIIN